MIAFFRSSSIKLLLTCDLSSSRSCYPASNAHHMSSKIEPDEMEQFPVKLVAVLQQYDEVAQVLSNLRRKLRATS